MTMPTASTSMIAGGNATVFVSDMERAVRFYNQTLGLKIVYRAAEHFCMIDAGAGFLIGLHPPARNASAPGTSGSIQIGLDVSQPIEEVMNTLRTRGVIFHGPAINDGAVKLAFFTDPDGNELYLCEVMH